MKRLPARTVLRIAALLPLLAGTPRPLRAEADAAGGKPRITAVRVGFDGYYKVGYWTAVEVDVRGGPAGQTGVVRLLLPDGDGVLTTVTTPPAQGVRATQRRSTARLCAKFGRATDDLAVEFLVDGEVRARRVYPPAGQADDDHIRYGLPSTDRLIVTVGPAAGIPAALAAADSRAASRTHVVSLAAAAQLPTRWIGYEGVDWLVLVGSDAEAFRSLTAESARGAALAQWLEQGGRLALFVGSEAAELLTAPSVLATLAPGRFDQMMPLPQTAALENYCRSEHPIDAAARLAVPRLRNVTGNIELYEGNQPGDLPLVIRAPYGFGQVVLAAVDPDRPPLSAWQGRPELLRKVLRRDRQSGQENEVEPVGQVATVGYTDLSGQLREALDDFDQVKPISFSVVATLVLVYILVIGPLDYWIVKRWFRRMELTWVTFPAWVVLFSVAAYYLAYWMKGDRLRVNQVEVVDVDTDRQLVRGSTWSHLFSPRPDAYNLSFQPALPKKMVVSRQQVVLSWMGLPGTALGGMSGGGPATSLFPRPYAFSPRLDQLRQVPVQVWSTKSFTARWTGRVAGVLPSELRETDDGLLAGTVQNQLGIDLAKSHLLYDRWVYALPPLKDGQVQTIGQALQPRFLKSWLSNEPYLGGALAVHAGDIPRIVTRMLFYEAAGGEQTTQLVNRYCSYCDLSDLLRTGRAVLLAWLPDCRSHLLRDGEPLAGPNDRHWSVYRFVIPVRREHHRD